MAKISKVDEKLPLGRLFPLGLQHVLAMYAGAVAVPLILGGAIGLSPQEIAFLIAADLFTCGIATLIQSFGMGNFAGVKLPVVMGVSFVAVGPMVTLSQEATLPVIYGGIIFAGLFITVFSGLIGKTVRFFPKVVTGTVITLVGLALVPVAMNNAAGGLKSPTYGNPENLLLAALTLIVVIVVNKYLKGFMQAIGVLIGLIVGTVAASALGMVNFDAVSNAGWFNIVTPFYFGLPEFRADAMIAMTIVSLVAAVEGIGVFIALGDIGEKEIKEKEISRGLRGEGLAQILGGVFNSFPYSTFSQNVGLVVLSGVRSRYVTVCAGLILVFLGTIPKFAALATVIPNAVLGGATLAMFGMVAVSGIRILSNVDFSKSGNMLIVAISLALGLGAKITPQMFAQFPQLARVLCEEGIILGSTVAIILNIVFNFKEIQAANKVEVVMHDDHAV